MSKLLRSELKEIVKECLVEILSEGLMSNHSKNNYNSKKVNELHNNKKSYLDNISYDNKKREQKERKINTNLTNDPLMNEILADTAMSTLHEQISADRSKGMSVVAQQGDDAAKIVDRSNPEDLFGEKAAGKWASLAFS